LNRLGPSKPPLNCKNIGSIGVIKYIIHPKMSKFIVLDQDCSGSLVGFLRIISDLIKWKEKKIQITDP